MKGVFSARQSHPVLHLPLQLLKRSTVFSMKNCAADRSPNFQCTVRTFSEIILDYCQAEITARRVEVAQKLRPLRDNSFIAEKLLEWIANCCSFVIFVHSSRCTSVPSLVTYYKPVWYPLHVHCTAWNDDIAVWFRRVFSALLKITFHLKFALRVILLLCFFSLLYAAQFGFHITREGITAAGPATKWLLVISCIFLSLSIKLQNYFWTFVFVSISSRMIQSMCLQCGWFAAALKSTAPTNRFTIINLKLLLNSSMASNCQHLRQLCG